MQESIHSGKKLFFFDKGYIAEFVYGGIDGAITTFAVVAGAAGGGLSESVVIILGMANLIADGFSMSVGNYLSTKAEVDSYRTHRDLEYWEIENLREVEVQEIRDIYAKKGFEGPLLEQVVEVITKDKDVWVDTMMKEELEMTLDAGKTPFKTALMTFVSFLIIGFIPLLAYVFKGVFHFDSNYLFWYSCVLTAIGLSVVGYLKAKVTSQGIFKGIVETVALGGVAAALSYGIGNVLEQWLS
jgi:VIT1/CCC1 family predicted Fe2+/Mn2+ transporter